MNTATPFEIFLVATPGLEQPLCEEATTAGFARARRVPGGVAFAGDWPDVWRANLVLRGATRVLARFAQFPAAHLAQLDKRARRLDWASLLRPGVPVAVDAVCKASRIYHAGAAAERVARAIAESFEVEVADEAAVRIMVRIEKNVVTISADTTGPSLHKRGFKEEVNRAPMRETMAAMFLLQCKYCGTEPVLDPMCGSGTFVIEAAEIAMGLDPGRARSFAFEKLAGFDAQAWAAMKTHTAPRKLEFAFTGSDRDSGAIRMSAENAERAGVGGACGFSAVPIELLQRPDGPPGLVIVNPPYGTRIGNKAPLAALYRTLGEVLRSRFSGWRAGIVTADPNLARATGLSFIAPLPPVLHGGMRIALYRTDTL